MTATSEDTDVEVDVDLDKPVRCEVFPPPGPCSTPATWKGSMACCPYSVVACDAHRQWAELVIAANILVFETNLSCDACGAPYVPPTWRPL